MHQHILNKLIPAVLCCCMSHYAWAQKVAEPVNHNEEWVRAYPPFRIVQEAREKYEEKIK